MKKKVLIIDDYEPLLEEVEAFLKIENFVPITACNGAEGIQLAMTEKPDLIICDIQMPKMTGFQVFKTLEKIPDTSTIPFVFLTAMAQVDDFRKGLNMGADDYITKPFDLDVLLAVINKRLEKFERYKNIGHDKFEALISSPLVGAFIYKKNEWTYTNSKFKELTSYTKLDLNRIPFGSIIAKDNDKIIKNLKLCLQGLKDNFQEEIHIFDKDKSLIHLTVFLKHIEIENEDSVIGTILNNRQANYVMGSDTDISLIVKYLKDTGKDEIAGEIINADKLLNIENHKIKDSKFNNLTKRELEILELICKGFKNSEIADKLFISSRTVDNHRANLLTKTETKNTAALVAYAVKYKIVEIL